jgi:hypothetical protein
MTLRDERPVRRCGVRGCPVLGRWDEGERCPLHRTPEWDEPRRPDLAETWQVDDEHGRR